MSRVAESEGDKWFCIFNCVQGRLWFGVIWVSCGLKFSKDSKGRKENRLPFRLHKCGAKNKGEFEGLKTLRGQVLIMESLSFNASDTLIAVP